MVEALYILYYIELFLASMYMLIGIRRIEGILRLLISGSITVINIVLLIMLAYMKMPIIWFSGSSVVFFLLTLWEFYKYGVVDGFYTGVEETVVTIESLDANDIAKLVAEELEKMYGEDNDDQP